jgi:preprotein translocase subunit Sss1
MQATLHIFVKTALDMLEGLFAIGLIGSTIVLIMSFWDDVGTIMGRH